MSDGAALFTVKVTQKIDERETLFYATQVEKVGKVQPGPEDPLAQRGDRVNITHPDGSVSSWELRGPPTGLPAPRRTDGKIYVMNSVGATVATYDI